MVYKILFFSNCTSFGGGYFFSNHKKYWLLTIIQPLKPGATFLRQYKLLCNRCVPYCKQFSIKVNISHFVHPSLGMQVDAKCVIWQKCGGVRNIPPIFSFTPKQVTQTGEDFKLSTLLIRTSVPSLCLCHCVPVNPISAIQQTVNVFPAAQPES